MIDVGSIVNGKYRLVRLLGDGGMGSVYEAAHAVLGTRVAIKVLHPELARRTGLVERFLQEARVAAQIRSPHVVQVTDVDRTADGYAYIVMELLEGEPLSAVLERQRKLPVTVACDYAVQVLEALEAAHALGVIHRDLKPENVFVTFAGGKPVLKLIDFGIAKARRTDPHLRNLTVAGVVMGTAEYMAPEQARSADKVDVRADLYAVGVMLYEMIAGSRPVGGDDARIIAHKVERGAVVPLVQVAPDVPREIAGLVHRAMAARPELRFSTATEMRLVLQGATSGKRPAASPPAGGAPVTAAGIGAVRAPAPVPRNRSVASPGRDATSVSVHQALDTASPRAQAASEVQGPPDTVRAPPIATALAAQAPAMPFAAHGGEASPPRRRRRGPVIALVAIPLLLGVGVVAVLLATGTWTFSAGPDTTSTPAAPAPPPPATTLASKPLPAETKGAPALQVPSLIPVSPAPAPPPPRPAPSSHGGGPPAPWAMDAGFPPFVIPSTFPGTLPPFPSVLPIPPGFPTSLPTSLPSIFPSVLPAWPPPLQPPTTASAAPPSAPGY